MRIVGHGVDLVDVARVAAMLDAHGERFLERCFTPDERAYAESRPDRALRLAARLAAKEAAFKAVGTGWARGVAWTDAEVVRHASGRPDLRVSGALADVAAELGVSSWSLSLSHTDALAMASVIATGQ